MTQAGAVMIFTGLGIMKKRNIMPRWKKFLKNNYKFPVFLSIETAASLSLMYTGLNAFSSNVLQLKNISKNDNELII